MLRAMTSELVPVSEVRHRGRIKDVLITVLTLSLCVSLAALIHETRQRKALTTQLAEQQTRLETQRNVLDKALATVDQKKAQSDRSLRLAQLAAKAELGAQPIASRLRQDGKFR